MVATYSCLQHQRVAPLLVVHGAADADLNPMFEEARRGGAWVLRSRNYAGAAPRRWQARNTVASLRDAAELAAEVGADHLVVMDPDLVWVSRVSWPAELATDRTVLAGLETSRARAIVARRGIELPADAPVALGCRVPYVVPLAHAEAIGAVWWAIMEDYVRQTGWVWTDQMAAFALALAELRLTPRLLSLTQTNLRPDDLVVAAMLHYAHETPLWDKGWFYKEDRGEWADLWHPPLLPVDTVQGWVSREIRRTRAYFDALEGAACA
jgi:hypothetical protein